VGTCAGLPALVQALHAAVPDTLRAHDDSVVAWVRELGQAFDAGARDSGSLDGRRMGMLRRNALCALALDRLAGLATDPYDLLLGVLRASLPHPATGADLPEAALLAAHASAHDRAFGSAWRASWGRFQAVFAAEGGRWRDIVETLLLLGEPRDEGDPLLEDILGGLLPGPGGDGLGKGRCAVARTDPAWTAFLDRVRRVVERDPRARAVLQEPDLAPRVVPRLGRRDAAAVALRKPPVFWNGPLTAERRTDAGVHLYLDVSGSAVDVGPLFFGLANALGDALALPAHAWSTEVAPLTASDIRQGRFRTTDGTDLGCVVQHARARGFGRILVFTDGLLLADPALVRSVRSRGPRLVLLLDAHSHATLRLLRRDSGHAILETLAEELIVVPSRGGQAIPF
jgi:hypothetical protein